MGSMRLFVGVVGLSMSESVNSHKTFFFQKAKVTPFAKVPPEVKRVDKPLGVIGQKANNPSTNNNSNNLGTLRGVSSPVTSVAVSSMSNSPLFTMSDNYSHRLKEDSYSRSLYSGYVESGSLASSQPNSIHSWDPKTLTSPTLRPPPGLAQSHEAVHRQGSLSGEFAILKSLL